MVGNVSSVLENMAEHVYAEFVQVRTSSYAEFVRVNILVWNPNHKLLYRLALYMLHYKEAAVSVA